MINREMDTGPRQLSEKGTRDIQLILSLGRVVQNILDRSYFSSETGIFSIDGALHTSLWCRELIGLNPNDHTLRVPRRGALLIQTLSGEVEKVVEAHDIREVVQSHSGRFRVYDSGYLLTPGFKNIGDCLIPQETEEFQQILLDAERGIKPPIRDPLPFIKVDPELAGQTLYRVSFKQYTEPIWMEDIVVIDDNGQLVPRTIYHSLSPYRWGWD